MTSTLPPPPQPVSDRDHPWRIMRWRFVPAGTTLAAIALGGVAFDLGVRHPIGILSFVSVLLTIAAGRWGGWVRGTLSNWLLVLALIPAGLLVLRASPWLVPLNITATLALLILSAVVRDEERAIGRAVGRLLQPVAATEPAVFAVDLIGQAVRTATRGREAIGRRLLRILTGAAIALPIFIALTLLLAASDAIFSSWLDIPINIPPAGSHLSLTLFGAILVSGWAGHGGWLRIAGPARLPRLMGGTETTIVLGSMVIVFGGFVAAQVVAISSGPAYVERTTGLTYAEYAREGFFQLVAAAVITLVALTALRRFQRPVSPRTARRIARLELATVTLTLLVVGVAIRRLFLYEAEFGLTMLRFSTIVFAAFIGFIFVVTGLHLASRLHRSPVAIVLSGALATLVVVNLMNPEAIVAQRNIDRFGGTDALDIEYLVTELGTDAYPTIATDTDARNALCRRTNPIDDRLITYNVSRSRAAEVCAS